MAVVCGPYFKGWFFGRRCRRVERTRGVEVAGEGRPGSFAGHAKQKHRVTAASQQPSSPRRPTSAIYWLSQPPDKGGQPRSIRGLPTHLPTHPSHFASSSPRPPRCFCPYSDSQHRCLTILALKIPASRYSTFTFSNVREHFPFLPSFHRSQLFLPRLIKIY